MANNKLPKSEAGRAFDASALEVHTALRARTGVFAL